MPTTARTPPHRPSRAPPPAGTQLSSNADDLEFGTLDEEITGEVLDSSSIETLLLEAGSSLLQSPQVGSRRSRQPSPPVIGGSPAPSNVPPPAKRSRQTSAPPASNRETRSVAKVNQKLAAAAGSLAATVSPGGPASLNSSSTFSLSPTPTFVNTPSSTTAAARSPKKTASSPKKAPVIDKGKSRAFSPPTITVAPATPGASSSANTLFAATTPAASSSGSTLFAPSTPVASSSASTLFAPATPGAPSFPNTSFSSPLASSSPRTSLSREDLQSAVLSLLGLPGFTSGLLPPSSSGLFSLPSLSSSRDLISDPAQLLNLVSRSRAPPLSAPPVSGLARLISPDDLIDHPHVVRLLREGWTSHIPIHCLATASSRALLHFTSDQRAVKEEDEFFMSTDAYREAAAIFPRLIRAHLPNPNAGAITDAFHKHFALVTSSHNFTSKFDVWRAYCIQLRKMYHQNSSVFNPGDFHMELWNFCALQLKEKRDSTLEARLHLLESRESRNSFRGSLPSGSAGPSTSGSFASASGSSSSRSFSSTPSISSGGARPAARPSLPYSADTGYSGRLLHDCRVVIVQTLLHDWRSSTLSALLCNMFQLCNTLLQHYPCNLLQDMS